VSASSTLRAGSVYSHNTEAAYAYLPHVDAGIFVVSVDPPLSRSEHQFLKDVREFVDKVFFVLNKIDQVSDADRKESLEFYFPHHRGRHRPGRARIYPLSARWRWKVKRPGTIFCWSAASFRNSKDNFSISCV